MSEPNPIHPAEVPVPRCTTCNVPLVLRYTMSLTGSDPQFLYQRDCKHRSALPTGPTSEMEWARIAAVRDVE